MTLQSRTYPNLYKDSVTLMTVSAQITAIPGIAAASVAMASASNVENLGLAGLGCFAVRPNDLIVALDGTEAACAEALIRADSLLKASASAAPDASAPEPLRSLSMAVACAPAANLALISVPGDYAAAEAMKALRLGMDVMIFSDNVPVAAERALKEFAEMKGLMVMGPDCGTAIVNGVSLGFANVVRRGAVGVVGASGTGMQELTVRIHQHGAGISQALGTGGHDLSDAIGGISMLQGLDALADDPATEVIVLVSKPPSAAVADRVLGRARGCAKPVVVIFLGADPAAVTGGNLYGAATLAAAADRAVALLNGTDVPVPAVRDMAVMTRTLNPTQRHVRGVFCGGTFCFEAQLVLAAAGHRGQSNAPVKGNALPNDIAQSTGNSFLDMGDDAFTQGRPHPMIDPSLRNARIRTEAADPGAAVVLFDVVLGYGASADPVSGLLSAIAEAKGRGSNAIFIGHVCGTDADPQDRVAIVQALEHAGVLVAGSNAEAAAWSAAILTAQMGHGA
jgi:FdrA protein